MTCFNLLMDRLAWAWGGVVVLRRSWLFNGLSIHNCARDANKPILFGHMGKTPLTAYPTCEGVITDKDMNEVKLYRNPIQARLVTMGNI